MTAKQDFKAGANPMQRTKPPFRADQVGSLLRPIVLKDARAFHRRGEIDDEDLRDIEDEEIKDVIRKQEEVGLKSVTDGEFRRSWWHLDFWWGLKGVERTAMTQGVQFHGMQTRAEGAKVTGKIDFAGHPMLDHFRFLKENTRATAKMTIPSPSVFHWRVGRNDISKEAYPDLEGFFEDAGKTYRKALRAFYDAGCRYLQLDDVAWAMLAAPDQHETIRQRGDDPARLPAAYARMMNAALEGKPSDLTVTTHVCRGNYRSTWLAEGSYEPIAEILFGQVNVDGYFLEYDTERAGGFEPLRYIPKGGKQVVLGLVTTKVDELEDKDNVKRRIDEATKFVAIDQLCLSPQCGFASTEEGNLLAEDDQWAKLRMIVEIADDVWG
jgi:5-methyltetrahydropteroyltriglutamate--homocysteine methyltransferase